MCLDCPRSAARHRICPELDNSCPPRLLVRLSSTGQRLCWKWSHLEIKERGWSPAMSWWRTIPRRGFLSIFCSTAGFKLLPHSIGLYTHIYVYIYALIRWCVIIQLDRDRLFSKGGLPPVKYGPFQDLGYWYIHICDVYERPDQHVRIRKREREKKYYNGVAIRTKEGREKKKVFFLFHLLLCTMKRLGKKTPQSDCSLPILLGERDNYLHTITKDIPFSIVHSRSICHFFFLLLSTISRSVCLLHGCWFYRFLWSQ